MLVTTHRFSAENGSETKPKPELTGWHTFRATGITAFLTNGGEFAIAQRIAVHESPRTTSLYNWSREELSQDEIERILI